MEYLEFRNEADKRIGKYEVGEKIVLFSELMGVYSTLPPNTNREQTLSYIDIFLRGFELGRRNPLDEIENCGKILNLFGDGPNRRA